MPRARSWLSTMRRRKVTNMAASAVGVMCVKARSLCHSILFLAAANAYIKADHAVLIARAHRGNIAGEKVLALDDLLRTLRDVGAVGQREIVGKLLLDRDLRPARGGIGLRVQALRIDLDAADSEQFFHAAAHSGVDRLVDDHGRRFVGEGSLTGLLLQLL